ncbi:MAG: hypothetical protein KDD82_13995 [Planctomycetes bacterium]|nr:hypothetical protein [Planctomycetota bacterium]
MRTITPALSIVCALLGAVQAQAQEGRLTLVREARCADLFGEGLDRYEASGVEFDGEQLRVVFDNSWKLGIVSPQLEASSAKLVDPDPRLRGSSDLEGLAYDAQGRLWGVVEGARLKTGGVHGLLVAYAKDSAVGPAKLPGELKDGGKGYEGLACVERDGKTVLLCLLEGNHGEGGDRGKDKGHGRIHAYVLDPAAKELPQPQVLEVPATAAFKDYSGIDVDGDRVAIVSQSSAKLWVGAFEPGTLKFAGPGRVYGFPVEEGAKKTTFDRVEGVVWLDAQTLACVSDRAKPDESDAHDQAIHVVRLPE